MAVCELPASVRKETYGSVGERVGQARPRRVEERAVVFVAINLAAGTLSIVGPREIALYLEPSARTRKRLERVATLLEGNAVDRSRLDSILSRHGLTLPEAHA